jgi:hypothetical protein
MPKRSSMILLTAVIGLCTSACPTSTQPGGNPQGDLDVELLNFTSVGASMGLVGGSSVVVPGNPSTGNPTIYRVTNPGLGNSLDFTATWSGQTQTATCTVTDVTGVSVPPGVVILPSGSPGFLGCSGW